MRRLDDANKAILIDRITRHKKSSEDHIIEFYDWAFRIGSELGTYSRKIEVVFYIQNDTRRDWWEATVQTKELVSESSTIEYKLVKTEYKPTPTT